MSYLKHIILMLFGLVLCVIGGVSHWYVGERVLALSMTSKQVAVISTVLDAAPRDIKMLLANSSGWHLVNIAENISTVTNAISELQAAPPGESLGTDTKINKRIEKLASVWSPTSEVVEQIAKRTGLTQKLFNDYSTTIASSSSLLAGINVSISEQRSSIKALSTAAMILVVVGALVLCVAVVTAIASASSVSSSIAAVQRKNDDSASKLGRLFRRVAEGDLGFSATESSAFNEEVANQFNEMLESWRTRWRTVSGMLAELSRPINAIEQSVAEGRDTVSGMGNRVAQVGDQFRQVSVTSKSLVEDSRSATHTCKLSTDTLRNGASSIGQVNERSEDARNQIQNTSKRVKRLGERLIDLENFVKSLSSLPERMEVMTLNATLEAGRAGEKGKGFMVIAEEIKSLGLSCAESLQAIQAYLGDIQLDTVEINEGMNQSIQLAIDESHLLEAASTSFTVGAQGLDDVGQVVDNVSNDSQQHNSHIDKVESLLEEIRGDVSEVSNFEGEIRRGANQLESSIAKIKETIESVKL